jgi:hypothetical protein
MQKKRERTGFSGINTPESLAPGIPLKKCHCQTNPRIPLFLLFPDSYPCESVFIGG